MEINKKLQQEYYKGFKEGVKTFYDYVNAMLEHLYDKETDDDTFKIVAEKLNDLSKDSILNVVNKKLEELEE